VHQPFLEAIAHKAEDQALTNVTLVRADQKTTNLAPDSIDLALLVDSYHHLELPLTYLADIHRALRPEGRLVVIDYDRTGKDVERWMKNHIRADPDEFLREIESAGFTLLDRPKLLDENFVFVFRR
jgi:SAM-dependent methyltransferase